MFFTKKESKPQYTLSLSDEANPLSAYAEHPFELDGYSWPTVAHYYHATKYGDEAYAAKIRAAATPAEAAKLGKSRWHKKRKDWNKVKTTVMTRGTYIKCRTYPEIGQALLDTQDKEIKELSLYDYFWGTGRDTRGKNAYGEMLMAVRNKLKQEHLDKEKD